MPPSKKQVAPLHRVECKCGAPAVGYAHPDSKLKVNDATQRNRIDSRTRKNYFTCQHGNEFECPEVEE